MIAIEGLTAPKHSTLGTPVSLLSNFYFKIFVLLAVASQASVCTWILTLHLAVVF